MARKVGLGILLPIRNGEFGYFKQGFDALTQIKSNFINLIMTKKGERIMQPSFGCDIHSIIFEKLTPTTEAEVKAAIDEAIQTWLPFVFIKTVNVQLSEDTNQAFVTVEFSITANQDITESVTFVL